MVSGASGWAQTYRGVYWTDDGGGHWRNITPASTHPASLQSVAFADPEHGWALSEEGRETHPRTALFATANGGRSWKRTAIDSPVRYARPAAPRSPRSAPTTSSPSSACRTTRPSASATSM